MPLPIKGKIKPTGMRFIEYRTYKKLSANLRLEKTRKPGKILKPPEKKRGKSLSLAIKIF